MQTNQNTTVEFQTLLKNAEHRRQVDAKVSIPDMTLDLTNIHCETCTPEAPCGSCQKERRELSDSVREHLIKVQESGADLSKYLEEATSFHARWKHRLEKLHLSNVYTMAPC